MNQLLSAPVLVGLSSVLTVGLGAMRSKVIALETGVTGVGVFGIASSVVAFGVVLFTAGLATSGVQATAAASADPARLGRTRSALLRGTLWLGLLAGFIASACCFFGILPFIPGEENFGFAAAVGLALATSVISGGQLAYLNGIGRIRAIALTNTVGSLAGTALTVLAGLLSGSAALEAAIAAVPLFTLLVSARMLRTDNYDRIRSTFRESRPEFRDMLLLGGVVALAALIASGTQALVRISIGISYGLHTAGWFQAAWTVTSTYLGFVLTALAAEYYPRISRLSADKGGLNRSVDHQIRLSLLVAAPVLMWMMVLADPIIRTLYSTSFGASVALVRVQVLGDLPKIVGWALVFLLLARRARWAYLIAELSWNASYVLIAIFLRTGKSLEPLGIAYVVSYGIYVVVALFLAHRATGFTVSRSTTYIFLSLIGCVVAVLAVLECETAGAYAVAVVLSSLTTIGASGFFVRSRRTRHDEGQSTSF